MKKIFCILLLSPLLLLSNMAKPRMDGSQHSVLYGSGNISVKKEIIDISVRKESVDDIYFVNYKIRYHIISEDQQTIPLLFIAIDLNITKDVKVNGISTAVVKLDFEKKNYPFIHKSEKGISVKYDKASNVPITPTDLIYFMASLGKGDNVIEVDYDAAMEYNTYGFVKDYKLEYSLYPSKFWKSFGPIEVNLIVDDGVELNKSNLGSERILNKNMKWVIAPQNRESIEIAFSEKTSCFSKFLLLLQPLGIAVIALFMMFFTHLKKMKRNPQKHVLVLGIAAVPVLFYVVYFVSFGLIDFSLGKDHTKHGYIFFVVLTYPFLLVIYWILMYQIYKRKILKS